MLALAKLRTVKKGGSDARCFTASPFLAFLVFFLSDWWEACATSAAGAGGYPGPPQAGTGRGCTPGHSCARSDQAGALERQKKHQVDIYTSL
jgi:hypothetical protein